MLSAMFCCKKGYSKSTKDLEEIKQLLTPREFQQNYSRNKALVIKAKGLQTMFLCGTQA